MDAAAGTRRCRMNIRIEVGDITVAKTGPQLRNVCRGGRHDIGHRQFHQLRILSRSSDLSSALTEEERSGR